MKKFIEELHRLPPDDLPGIPGAELSDRCISRIASLAHKKIGENSSPKKSRTVRYIRRASAVIAAAAVITAAATAVYAYRDEISHGIEETKNAIIALFVREQEIIDPKAEMINEIAEESGITLTVEKAVRDGDQAYLCIALDNHDGMFRGDILTCEEYTLYKKADYPGAIMPKNGYSVSTHKKLGMMGVYAGDIFALLRMQPSDHVELMIPVNIDGKGSYRFTIDRLLAVSDETDAEGYTGNLLREVIAEELTVDFTIDSELESLERTVIECGREFELSGVTFRLDSITVSPLEIVADIHDTAGRTIEIGGYEIDSLAVICGYNDLYDALLADPALTREEAVIRYRDLQPKDQYRMKISFTDANLTIDEMNSFPSWGYSWDRELYRMTFKTPTPVYPEEIAKIWLENDSDEDDVIVIFEN